MKVSYCCGDDELVRVGAASGVFDLGVRGIVPAIGDVLAHRSIEQKNFLLHDREQAAVGFQAELANVRTIEQEAPLRRIVKARDKIGHRRLPRPAAAHQRDDRSSGDGDALKSRTTGCPSRYSNETLSKRISRTTRGASTASGRSGLSFSIPSTSKTRSMAARERCISEKS